MGISLNVWMRGRNLKVCESREAGKFPLKMINDCGLYVVCIPNMVCFMLPPELHVGVFSVPELFTRTAAI